jgi:transcriptional regulator with XRE-family HTH domain
MQKDLGQLLKHTRTALGLTQQALGDRHGATRQTIARWEEGDIPNCAAPTVCKIIGDAISEFSGAARKWRVDHDWLEHNHEIMKAQILAAVSNSNRGPK